MTLEHSSVAYFQVILAHFQWWLYFVKLLDSTFFKHTVKDYLARDEFYERKSDISRSEIGKASYLLNGPCRNDTKAQIKRSFIAKVKSQLPRHQHRLSVAGSSFSWLDRSRSVLENLKRRRSATQSWPSRQQHNGSVVKSYWKRQVPISCGCQGFCGDWE